MRNMVLGVCFYCMYILPRPVAGGITGIWAAISETDPYWLRKFFSKNDFFRRHAVAIALAHLAHPSQVMCQLKIIFTKNFANPIRVGFAGPYVLILLGL